MLSTLSRARPLAPAPNPRATPPGDTTTSRKLRWTDVEVKILHDLFPKGGATRCQRHLPDRTATAIEMKAGRLGLVDHTAAPPAGLRPPLAGCDLAEAVWLRTEEKWSYRRLGTRYGVCAATVANALLAAESRTAGFRPAKRDSSGGLKATDVKRLHDMLMQGLRHVDIQRQLAISASCVSNHRRRLAARLRDQDRSNLLPPAGGGAAYSGRKIPAKLKREAERLLMQQYGARIVSRDTGISRSQVQRIRSRLVERLARKGERLPGCDQHGCRVQVRQSARRITPYQIEQLRTRLLARQPVARAARDLGIGACSAYGIRDKLAAELRARGDELPRPIRPSRGGDVLREVLASKWMPEGKLQRYRTLLIEHGPEEAKRIVIAEADAERRAAASRPKTFAEQLARVAAGAKLVEKPRLRRADPDMTLGGVASYD